MPILPDPARLGRSASCELRPVGSLETREAREAGAVLAILDWRDARTP